VSGLHKRIINIVEDKLEDYKDQLGYEDVDDEDHVPLKQI
jgi:hypothetical protein